MGCPFSAEIRQDFPTAVSPKKITFAFFTIWPNRIQSFLIPSAIESRCILTAMITPSWISNIAYKMIKIETIKISEIITSIFKFGITNNNLNKGMNGEKIGKECVICFIDLEKDDYCMLDCAAGHLIHHSCIDRWIKKGNKRCPIDRMELKRCIHAGMVEVFASPVPENQRCFLCNQAYEPKENPILKCKICRINPCHSKCLQEISTDMLSLDFNAKQVCENCSYQVRQLQIFERMHIIALRNQYQKLERAKKKIDERQASILESIEKYESRLNSMEED